MLKNIRPVSLFIGGVLFGSAGLSILASRDAKKAYAHAVAAGIRAKDCLLATVTRVREGVGDVLAEARDINAERAENAVVVEDGSESKERA